MNRNSDVDPDAKLDRALQLIADQGAPDYPAWKRGRLVALVAFPAVVAISLATGMLGGWKLGLMALGLFSGIAVLGAAIAVFRPQ